MQLYRNFYVCSSGLRCSIEGFLRFSSIIDPVILFVTLSYFIIFEGNRLQFKLPFDERSYRPNHLYLVVIIIT